MKLSEGSNDQDGRSLDMSHSGGRAGTLVALWVPGKADRTGRAY
jgi:hypothetical protein